MPSYVSIEERKTVTSDINKQKKCKRERNALITKRNLKIDLKINSVCCVFIVVCVTNFIAVMEKSSCTSKYITNCLLKNASLFYKINAILNQ